MADALLPVIPGSVSSCSSSWMLLRVFPVTAEERSASPGPLLSGLEVLLLIKVLIRQMFSTSMLFSFPPGPE